MLVEFIGLPGVGKSILVQELKSTLESRGIPLHRPNDEKERRVISKSAQLVSVARSLVTRPGYVRQVVKVILSTRQSAVRDYLALTFHWLSGATAIRDDVGDEGVVWVIDQGLFQMVWAIMLGAQRPDSVDLIRELFKSVRLPDVVVIVKAPLGVVEERLMKRATNSERLNRLLLNKPEQLVRADRLMDETEGLVDYIVRVQKHMCVVRVENATSTIPKTSIRDLADMIEQLYRESNNNVSEL